MSIIHEDIERHFQDVVSGRAKGRVATAQRDLATAVERRERRLPNVDLSNRVVSAGVGFAGQREEHIKIAMGGADVTQSAPEIRNPLLSLINFYLPYDRKTMNQWIRYYNKMDPYVRNCTRLNGQFPISDFHFSGIQDPDILQQFEDLKERCRMLKHAFESSQEDEILGEVFTFWQWDEDDLTWNDYTILNPDRLDVREINWGSGMIAAYSYDPPEELKALMRSSDPQDQAMLSNIDPAVLEALASNSRIPLDSFNMMAMVRKDHPYDPRGTSPILPALKALMYKDKLIEAQYAIADQQITPVQLWKIGDSANDFMPNEQQLHAFRQLLEAGRHDPLFTIVTHAAVNLELIGYTGKLLPILPELEWVAKQVMIALYTNEATISGSGPSYGAAVVPFKILQGRYQAKRDGMVDLYRQKLLKPFAEAREMFVSKPADYNGRIRTRRTPILPKIDWNFKLDLTDSAQKMQYLMQLREKSAIPMRVLTEVFNLDYETVKQNLKDEEGTVFDPVYQASRAKRGEQAAETSGTLDGIGGSEMAGSGGAEAPAGAEGGEKTGEEPGGGGEGGGAAPAGEAP